MFWCAQDPEQFIEDGGWNFLDQEGGDDEGEDDDEEEDDQEFAPASDEEVKRLALSTTSSMYV
jgi:nucleosome binding factor SPN SPT16 subunit